MGSTDCDACDETAQIRITGGVCTVALRWFVDNETAYAVPRFALLYLLEHAVLTSESLTLCLWFISWRWI
jgi:hypothetical protein